VSLTYQEICYLVIQAKELSFSTYFPEDS
jgi:hypothetical protein